MKRVALWVPIICMIAGLAQASLINGDFNDPASGDPPTGWTPWGWGGGWANHENNPAVTFDGSHYLVVGATGGGGGGFFQIVPAAAGTQYELTVLSGADAWWLPTGIMRMFFLDSADAEVGFATRNTVDPADYGGTFDTPHPWASYSLNATAPAGTTQVKVEFASNDFATGSIWFENGVLSVIPEPGSVGLVLLGSGLLIGNRARRRGARA